MSLVGVISLVGVVFGIELTLRIVDYLYTRKIRCMGNNKKNKRHGKAHKKHSKAHKKNGKTIETD